MAIPIHHTTRQASQPPTAAQIVFVERVADAILFFIRHRLEGVEVKKYLYL